MHNPFIFKEIPLDAPFCNRTEELKELLSYAKAGANVLIYSPRRFGKTSLVKRIQNKLKEEGAITIFVDFFGVSSVEDVAGRIAKAIFEVTRTKENLFKSAVNFIKSFRPVLKPDESGTLALSVEPSAARKSGIEVLEETMSNWEDFVARNKEITIHVAFDEFQEITELKENSAKIEGIMRSYIQRQQISYFFIGSRRRILLAMFNDRSRPFFQSAIGYELKKLPLDELSLFISERFKEGGKTCDLSFGRILAEKIGCHPYYSQKLAFFIYESSENYVKKRDIDNGFNALLESERVVYEIMLQGLAPKQIALLMAIAVDPSGQVFSIDYMKRHNLGSVGGVQGAKKRLIALDLIEQDDAKKWNIVDPVFKIWLQRRN